MKFWSISNFLASLHLWIRLQFHKYHHLDYVSFHIYSSSHVHTHSPNPNPVHYLAIFIQSLETCSPYPVRSSALTKIFQFSPSATFTNKTFTPLVKTWNSHGGILHPTFLIFSHKPLILLLALECILCHCCLVVKHISNVMNFDSRQNILVLLLLESFYKKNFSKKYESIGNWSVL